MIFTPLRKTLGDVDEGMWGSCCMKTIPVPVLFFVFSILAISSLIPVDSYADPVKRTLVVATSASMSPMEMIGPEGNIVGYDIDIIRAVASKAGLSVEIRNHAWTGLLSGLEQGMFDAVISTVTITEKRRERFDFSEPYINIGQVLVVPVEMDNVTGLDDMKELKAGAVRGSLGAAEVKRAGVELRDYDETDQALQAMAAGRIHVVVCDYVTAAGLISGSEIYKDRFRIAGPPFTGQECGIVLRKGNTEILEMINKGVLAVKAEGISHQLEMKWFKQSVVLDNK